MLRRREKSSRVKRPVAVTVIAAAVIVLFFARLYRGISPLLRQRVISQGLPGPLYENGALTPLGWDLASSVFYLLLVVALVLTLIGFLRLRRWSWVVLMVWTGLSLGYALVQYFFRQPNYLVMASNTVIVLALSQRDVQIVFGIRAGGQEGL